MGACKDLWMDEVERIGDDFAADKISHEEAMESLIRKGFEPYEAATMLDEVIS